MENYKIVTLEEAHRDCINNYCCNQDELNKYLKENAIKESELGIGITKIGISDEGEILFYYTLCCSSIVESSSGIRIIYRPAVEIKFFSVNKRYHKIVYDQDEEGTMYYSDLFLADVINDINTFTSNTCAAEFVVLYSVPEAVKFFSRNLFDAFEEFMEKSDNTYLMGCTPMFMTL